ncbi:MAG: PhnD/SsuA/transferrin family substrate-binding protein [Cyanobacteria bacterium P01_D01_bin.105]
MRRRNFLGCSVLFLASATVACSPVAAPPAATELPALRLAVTDVSGEAELEKNYGEFRAAIATALETDVEFVPVDNYTAATVALKQGKIDLVLAGPSEYVVISSRTNAVPVIAVTRPNYQSVLAIPANSDVSEVAGLEGKSIAMSDIGSTSGHLGPTYLLMEAGLDPKADVTVQMLGDDGSAAALKTGDVEAWGGSATDFNDLLADESNTFKVLLEGPPLPSDVMLASSSVDAAVLDIVRERMLDAEAEIVGALAAHESKYVGSTLEPASDKDYDSIRAVYQAIGQGELVQ